MTDALTTDLRNMHDITCNYRSRPLFSDGCICKVVNKHEHQREIEHSLHQAREIVRLRAKVEELAGLLVERAFADDVGAPKDG